MAGLEPYDGKWGRSEALHLLRRTTFGNKRSDLSTILALSVGEAVDHLSQSQALPDPPVNEYTAGGEIDPDVALGETWVDAPWLGGTLGLIEYRRLESLRSWFTMQIYNQECSLHMKMILFLNSIVTNNFTDTGQTSWSYHLYLHMHQYALGNYKTFVSENAVDANMLKYLNGDLNKKGSPDENYAREVQELFTIGKGPNSEYTEEDVRAAARVMTGWRFSWPTYGSTFSPTQHDTDNKQFSAFYNNHIIQGRSGEDGQLERDEFIDMLFSNQETSYNLARRIYIFFVFPEVTEEVEQNIITPLAQIIRDNNFELLPPIKALIKSAHFFENQFRGAIIKSPVDFLMGMMRTLEVQFPSYTSLHSKHNTERSPWYFMNEIGLGLGDAPSVAGWKAYYQAPLFDKSWMNTTTIARRGQILDDFLTWGFYATPPGIALLIDPVSFVTSFDTPADPNALLNDMLEFLLGYDQLEMNVWQGLKDILLSNQPEDSYWSQAWILYEQNPNDVQNKSVVETRIKALLKNIFQLAEFQLH